MYDVSLKEVNFKKYCDICKHRKKLEFEDPCNECLEVGMRDETEKPEYFEEK